MALLPLVPGIRPSVKELDAGSTSPAKLKALTEQALKRDDRTCRFCGFKSNKYQRTVPNKQAGEPPLATSCTFCEQCVALERAGVTGNGILIWLPEMEQAALNHLARAIYIARAARNDNDNEEDEQETAADQIKALANRAFDALAARRGEAKKRLGTDDPMMLATVMHESLSGKERGAVSKRIEGIRILPSEKHMIRTPRGDVNYFPQMVAYWLSKDGPYAGKPVAEWLDLFKQAASKVGNA